MWLHRGKHKSKFDFYHFKVSNTPPHDHNDVETDTDVNENSNGNEVVKYLEETGKKFKFTDRFVTYALYIRWYCISNDFNGAKFIYQSMLSVHV